MFKIHVKAQYLNFSRFQDLEELVHKVKLQGLLFKIIWAEIYFGWGQLLIRKMGFFDKLASFLGLKRCECNVLVVGLDNSGKTTILNHFKPDEQKHLDIVPTVGFNVEKFKSRLFNLSMFWAPPLSCTVVLSLFIALVQLSPYMQCNFYIHYYNNLLSDELLYALLYKFISRQNF